MNVITFLSSAWVVAALTLAAALLAYLLTRSYPIWRLGYLSIAATLWFVIAKITAESLAGAPEELQTGAALLLLVTLAGVYLLAVNLRLDNPPDDMESPQ